METEDVKVTAINMYKYKKGLRFYKRWSCSPYISKRNPSLDLVSIPTLVRTLSLCGPISISRANAHMVHSGALPAPKARARGAP